jgi:hypothetical protein
MGEVARLRPPEPLTEQHDLGDFSSGEADFVRNRIKLITDSQIVITDSHEADHVEAAADTGRCMVAAGVAPGLFSFLRLGCFDLESVRKSERSDV